MACPEITPDAAAEICDVIQHHKCCTNIPDCKDCPFVGPDELKAFIKRNNEEKQND